MSSVDEVLTRFQAKLLFVLLPLTRLTTLLVVANRKASWKNFFAASRARLTIGQTGQMPRASCLQMRTLLYWFFMFSGYSPLV